MSGQITVIGLGPGDADLRTVGAQRALDAADHIVLRTQEHPGIADVVSDERTSACDDIYERAASFDEVYPAIAQRVIALATAGANVVYAVPGHPRFAERSVILLQELATEHGIPITVQDAVSFVDVVGFGCGQRSYRCRAADRGRTAPRRGGRYGAVRRGQPWC